MTRRHKKHKRFFRIPVTSGLYAIYKHGEIYGYVRVGDDLTVVESAGLPFVADRMHAKTLAWMCCTQKICMEHRNWILHDAVEVIDESRPVLQSATWQ
jgi:hypothetical protein